MVVTLGSQVIVPLPAVRDDVAERFDVFGSEVFQRKLAAVVLAIAGANAQRKVFRWHTRHPSTVGRLSNRYASRAQGGYRVVPAHQRFACGVARRLAVHYVLLAEDVVYEWQGRGGRLAELLDYAAFNRWPRLRCRYNFYRSVPSVVFLKFKEKEALAQ